MSLKIRNTTVSRLLGRYVELLKGHLGEKLLSIALFGSAARGTARFPGSDIDIMVVAKGIIGLSFGERMGIALDLEERMSKTGEYAAYREKFGRRPKFQEIIFDPEELRAHPPILLDMTTDAVVLYDAGILQEELDRMRKRMRELGSRKVKHGDSWFWILKPDMEPGEVVEI
ncbi:MAG TPA: nucleotidyltransferase domain-containing protein [Candidatus Methanoperedenaceae archaeon]|nr:nucleotidyltransferase domain-containing protein [Candidatus Methanoperedenaceae archaeon]